MLRYLLAATLILQTTACDSFYAVVGTVSDASTGRPIAGAHVEVELHDDGDVDRDAADTDDQGSFTLVLNAPASDLPSTLSVSGEGYVSLTRIVSAPDHSQCISLTPERP